MLRIFLGAVETTSEYKFQSTGGMIVFCIALLWTARAQIKNVIKKAFTNTPDIDDSDEPLSYRQAFFGALVGFIFIIGWCMAIGLHWLWALALFFIYFCMIIVLTRLVAEAGMYNWWSPMKPQEVVIRVATNKLVNDQTYTTLSIVGFQIWDFATCVMAQAMSAFKIADLGGFRKRTLCYLLLSALVISVIACHIPCLYVTYKYGAPNLGTWMAKTPSRVADEIGKGLHSKNVIETRKYGHIGLGAIVTMALLYFRRRFVWWPFHPLGFIAAYTIERYWFAFFLGWLAKVIVLKLGGIRTYKKLYAGALGLILGDAVILFLWLIFHYFLPIDGILVEE